MNKNLVTIVASVLLSCLAAYGIVSASTTKHDSAQSPFQYEGSGYRTVNLAMSDYPDFTFAAESAVDAVVYVEVTVQASQRYQLYDPLFDFFFGGGGQGRTQPFEQKGSGSGVIIRPDGYIVTNNHVVANATSVKVTLNNNKSYDATVLGTDPATDVALIKIDAQDLPSLEFGDSDNLRLGEWVLAIGSPMGRELQSTITAGIVSAKGRSLPNERGEYRIESFIQTDAAVNPGNSGGALVNKAGQLIGINTAIVSATGSFTGYSFAIPSNIVKRIISDLIDFGSIKRAFLGITMQELDEKLADELKLPTPNGVYITEVSSGSAADKAGLKKGDVLVAVDSSGVRNASAVQAKVSSYRPGDKAVLTVIRDAKQLQLPVTFMERPEENVGEVLQDGTVSFYGATLKAVENGVLIVSAGNGKLAQAGAHDGFVIQFVNSHQVKKPQDVIDQAKKSRRAVLIEGVNASGRPGYFAFSKDE